MQNQPLLRAILTACAAIILVLALLLLFSSSETAFAGDNIWTWTGVSGYPNQIVTDPLNPGTVYAVINNSQIKKSTDGGTSWADIADPSWSHIRKIALAPSAPGVLFASSSSGVFRSMDGGDSWQIVHSEGKVDSIAVSPVDWKEVYIGSNVISKTLDGGQTWATISAPIPDEDYTFMNIAIAPSAPHILVASPWNTSTYLPWKSTDSGQTWSEMTSAPAHINTIAFDPQSSNILYLGTIGLAWKSSDGGSLWQPLANGLQTFAWGFVIHPDNTQVVHAANGAAGVLESLDGGASWLPINTGIQGLAVDTIAIASRRPLTIYAGVQGGGIWKLTRTAIQDFSVTVNDAAIFTNQAAVTLRLTAPPGTTEMQVSNDGGFGGAAWEPFASSKPWTITTYGDSAIPRTVYVKFKTNGRVSSVYQDDIILDQTPPSGTIQIVEAGTSIAGFASQSESSPITLSSTSTYTTHLPLMVSSYLPGLRLLGLSLSATDNLSGVDRILVSNDAVFDGAEWQPYVQDLDWYVSEQGTTTVYVKFRDRAGNESQVYSATTTAP